MSALPSAGMVRRASLPATGRLRIPEPAPRVVVIGGSAGGVEALLRLVAALPERPLPAYVVVLHQPAGHRSLLAEVLQAHARCPVQEACDKQPMTPGTVHVAPPDYHLLIERDGRLALSVDEPVHFSRPSIDLLFESAAWACGADTLGVVLTGANEDGAAGLAAIRRAGGRAWVQRPSNAAVDAMPRAALQVAGADRVMGLGAIAARLARWSAN